MGAGQFHLLDDGFQHRALARDFDIVLVTPEDAATACSRQDDCANPCALGRADAVVLYQRRFAGIVPDKWKDGLARAPGHCSRKCSHRSPWFFAASPGRRIFSCSCDDQVSIRQPKLSSAIIMPTPRGIFATYCYAAASDAEGFVTTEKDAINLGGKLLHSQPLAVVPVKMELDRCG